jgi:hypothetical protein
MYILQNNEILFRKEKKIPLQKKSVRHHPERINNKFPSGRSLFAVSSKSFELQEDKTGGKQPTSLQLEANKFDNTTSTICIFFSNKLVRYCLESLTHLGL